MEDMMRPSIFYSLCFAALLLPTTPALSVSATNLGDQRQALNQIQLVQGGQCTRRIGPVATEDTAWARWRAARGQGYPVGFGGVFSCRSQSGRSGYCFDIFFPC